MPLLNKSVFFWEGGHLIELRSLLEDKYKLFSMLPYQPSCPTTRAWFPSEILTNQCRTQNRPSSPPEDYCFSTLLTLQCKLTARVQQGKTWSVLKCL